MTQNKISPFLSLLIITPLLSSSAALDSPPRILQALNPPQDIKQIDLSTYYPKYFEDNSDHWAYFQLDLSTQINANLSSSPETTDLIIEVIQTGEQFNDPNIFINFNEAKPNLTTFSLRCSFYGEDICVINGRELLQTQFLTIGVFCKGQCSYKVQAELTKELLFTPGKSHRLYFLAHQQRIIRFSIPDDENVTSVEIQGINEDKFAKFEMLMTKGNDLPNSENSLYLRPAWENGYVGKFNNDCQCFCKNCNYTILVSAQEAGYITLISKINGQLIDLTSSKGELFDSVLYYHIQWYSFNVTHEDRQLTVKLEVYSGDPDLYVNPLKIPSNIYDAQFNSKDHFENEELILAPADRAKIGAVIGTYYIGVFGKTAATYKLTVKNKDHSIFLKSGLSESGYLESKQVKFFYFREPILALQDVDVSFQLHVMTGTARLRANLCEISEFDDDEKMKSKCNMTYESMFASDPNEKVMAHIGAESEKTNTSICKIGEEQVSTIGKWLGIGKTNRSRAVSCAYVIGLAGLTEYTTHYSVMVKTQGKVVHTVLKEGKPVNDEILDNQAQYYIVTINDPSVTKLTIQMTTIHGDPDLFVSKTKKEPDYNNFDKRSVRCGIYPEVIEYTPENATANLVGEYYIAVFGYTQSTFHLVYFTESSIGGKQSIHLLNGIQQRAVMHSTEENMVFKFTLSNKMKEDIEVRLHSENGFFKMIMGTDYIPTPEEYDQTGDEHNPIMFKQEENLEASERTTYYIRVDPLQVSVTSNNQSADSAGMAYVFTLAFYESGSFIHLSEGQPIRGQVENNTFDYYYIEVKDATDYHLTLTPLTGDPDIVIALNQSNEFPDRQNYDMISEGNFSNDVFVIPYFLIQTLQNQSGQTIQFIYIGIYANGKPSTYSILHSVPKVFKPIKLSNGQIQSGSLPSNTEEMKHYYFKTSSSMPLYATLVPKQGNPDMQISIISDTSLSMKDWESYVSEPSYTSEESFGADIIYLNPNSSEFKTQCGSSCIVLISIKNADPIESHFTITVTRDIIELVENMQISDSIRDFGQYRYYKFYKSCANCDLEIQVTPLQVSENLYLLGDFDIKNTLPTHQNSPKWFFNVKYSGAFVIKADDTHFVNSKKNITSKGTFVIALHGHQNISYTISVHTIVREDLIAINSPLQPLGFLDIRKVYLGESQPYFLSSGDVKYFYFENWNNATLKFQYLIEGKLASASHQTSLDMRVTTLSDGRVPKLESELMGYNHKWISTRDFQGSYNSVLKDTIQVNHEAKKIKFCVQCFFIIRVENVDHTDSLTMRLIVEQESEIEYGFKSTLVVGKPYNLRLSKGQKAGLQFHLGSLNGNKLQITAQVFNGRAELDLYQNSQLINSTRTEQSLQSIFDRLFGVPTILVESAQLTTYQTYEVWVSAVNEDLHCSILVIQQNQIYIIPDGIKQILWFKPESSVSKFLYIPPSRKFFLTLGATPRQLNASVTISVKKLDIQHGDENATEDWRNYKQGDFDYVFSSKNNSDWAQVFQMVPIELEDEDDMLFIQVEGEIGSQIQNAYSADFYVSGSEIQFIKAYQTMRGVVSNKAHAYKVFEFYINKNELIDEVHGTTDLYIEVTPCNGRVQFYVSDNFPSLFNNKSYINTVDILSFEKFGKSAKRIKNIGELQVVYIGIESVNEVFSYFEHQDFSEFEISVKYLKSKDQDLMEKYVFEKSNREISLVRGKNPEEFLIQWNKIYERVSDKMAQTIKPVDFVTYTLIMSNDSNARYQMGAQCQIDQLTRSNQTLRMFSVQNHSSLSVSRSDIEDMQVVGILAYVSDDSGINALTFEPTILQSGGVFRMKHHTQQMYVAVLAGTGVIVLLAAIAIILRKKGIILKRRLDLERGPHHEMQEMENSRRGTQIDIDQ